MKIMIERDKRWSRKHIINDGILCRRREKEKALCERERVHYKKKIVINRSYYSPASAIVIYRESDLCAHLIGAVLTLAIVEETLFFFVCAVR